MTLGKVGSSGPVVVARASVECRVNSEKLARVGHGKRSRCCEKHRQDNPVCAFHGEWRPMQPNDQGKPTAGAGASVDRGWRVGVREGMETKAAPAVG